MRSLGALLAMLVGSSVLVGVLASTSATAGATVTEGGSGYLKICKVWTASSVASATGPFVFYYDNGAGTSGSVSVDAGACSNPIPVPAGTYTVTEQEEPWYQITAIAELDSLNEVTYDATALPGYTPAYAGVLSGNETVVQFTDALVTGQTEICKSDVPNDTLSGTFSFNLTNTDDEASGSGGLVYDIPVSVTIPTGGTACSDPVTVPAGVMEVTEAGTNLYVTSISANLDSPTGINLLLYANDTDGASESLVLSSSLGPEVTVVSYTNATVGLEICKAWDGDPSTQPQGTSTTYSFSETASGAAGPNTAPPTFTLEAGQCSTPTAYRAGTTVTITEGVTPGTEVRAINAYGAESTLPDNDSDDPNLATRSVSLIIGTPVTSTGSSSDAAVVYFVDGLAVPSTLKICKDAPAGSGPFTFTVAGPQYVSKYTSTGTLTTGWFYGEIANQSFTVSVPANECEFATPPTYTGDPNSEASLPYNSTQLVTESGTANFMATAITANVTNVGVFEDGVFTSNGESVLSNITLGATGGASSVDVTMSEGPSETIVTWTNVDPPPPAAAPGPVTVANPGGSNAGTTTTPTLATAIKVATAVSKLTSHERALLAKYEHSVMKLDKSIKAAEKSLKSLSLSKSAHSKLLKHLAHLRAERVHLALLILKLTL